MGSADEAGKAVAGFFDALKTQPLSLALVVMNIALLALLYFLMSGASADKKTELQMVFESQKDVRQLLARCVIPKD